MNSAIGNFDGTGVRLSGEQTPENNDTVTISRAYFNMLEKCYRTSTPVVTSENVVTITVDRAYFDLLERAYNNNPLPVVTNTPFPAVTETPSVTINVFDYITSNEWDTFCALVSAMLANGANLFEIQQRVMGLS